MEVVRFKVKGKHNLELSCIKVEPKKEPKVIIQIFHGMGDHKERYIPFMKYLAENGYGAYAHDHRKQGTSVTDEGQYGILLKEDTWDDMVDDCYFVSRRILKDHPGKKIVVLGHSIGSILARSFLSRYATTPKGAIIMGTLPPYKMTTALLPMFIARFMRLFTSSTKRSEYLANTLNKPMLKQYKDPRTKFDWISSDDTEVDKYVEDELCGYAYTPQYYIEVFKGIVEVNKSNFILQTKENPILFIAGDADPVGQNGLGVKEVYKLYDGHGFTQLTLKLVSKARHEILNEVDKLTTFEYIKDWLDKNI